MAGVTQWIINYTRHKSQKRKVYHEGKIVLECCNTNQRKVLLYDDFGKLLDYRFLRNNEEVEIGKSLEFDSSLVEIYDTIEKEPCSLGINNEQKEIPLTKKGFLHKGVRECPIFPRVKVVEETKKLGQQFNQGEVNMKDSNLEEWHVVYTKQKKQKMKKYNDGVLRLLVLGARQRQVILLTEDGKVLEKRYFNCQEDIESNCTLEFEEYLVDVGEPKVCQTVSKTSVTSSNEAISIFDAGPSKADNTLIWSSKDVSAQYAKDLENNTFRKDIHERSKIGLDCNKHMDNGKTDREPIRTVNQILTVLKMPKKDKIHDAPIANPIPECSISPKIAECFVPNIFEETSKQGAQSEYSYKERVPEYDVNNEGSSLESGKGIHVDKRLSQGSSMESVKSISFPTIKSVKRSIRRFQAPTIEFSSSIHHLVFPEINAVQKFRQAFIPKTFTSLSAYRHIMSSAVYDEINLTLFDIGNEFHKAKQRISHLNKQSPLCEHGRGRLQSVKKDGPNKGRLFYGCPLQVESCLFTWADKRKVEIDNSERFDDWSTDEMEHAFSCFHVDLYTNCEMFTRKVGNSFSKKRRHVEYENGEEVFAHNKASTYLKLGSSRNHKRSSHSKGDLWIISSNINFSKERREDFLIFAVSDYHGPSSDGILEVVRLGGKPQNLPVKKAFSLHGPCIQSELTWLNILRDMHTPSMPLLPLLLQPYKNPTQIFSNIEVEKLADQFIAKYNLNEDQAKAVHLVAKWFRKSSDTNSGMLSSEPEICLIHGIFGSGKSYLLTVIVIFLTSVSKRWNGQKMRILISAATNVAIDRVLTGLLELGFNDFIRVGSIKKIARNIFPYSVYATSDANYVEDIALKEMQERLKEASSYEKLEIEEEIKSLRNGKMAHRREKLKDGKVVGVTCYSTINPILKGNKFQICILDECAQIPEPLSLLPLSQFGCLKLIAVGDPTQLPPALLGGSDLCDSKNTETTGDGIRHGKNFSFERYENESEGSASFHDLRRSLFVRLVEMGYEPIMLRTQYRCHPRLIHVPNELFYGGRIMNGCREIDRPPLLPGLPPLLFWDTCTHGNEVKDSFKSYSNLYEAKIACELINMMLENGIPGCSIGVIVLYKSQASLVQELLFQGCHLKGGKICRSKSSKVSENKQLGTSKVCKDGNPEKDRNVVEDVQISTVDAFQGMEKNIIILSCCRTNGLGFLLSPNRLNVALTRSRHHLIVVGKASNLNSSPMWKIFLSDAASGSGSYISTSPLGLEVVIDSMRKHISGKNGSHRESVSHLTSIEEQTNSNKTPDVDVLNALQIQFDNEEKSTTQIGDALHASDLLQGVAGEDDDSHLCVNNDIDMTDLVESGCASLINNYHDDLQRSDVGQSQTAHADSMECAHANEDRSDFKCGETEKFVLSDATAGLLKTGPMSDFGIACIERLDRDYLPQVKQAEGDCKLIYGSASFASEQCRNDFGREYEHEAKDSDGDDASGKCNDVAPNSNLGLFTD
ncbi:hypothetical protein SUGI_0275470 [Cryptomeria japonica]|uniref:uncharacterized protein LOC131075078 isoform X2 n=1 Tax=Cryptomeria japonica TaxID=3369 RepID=UPI002408B807|nr:uncharacterized protein LOC131075078 isoform X2 [Cryptomeria japonica]GLJ16316.1 hypothetical protein SUGI_0275470 [Cryptomeria japonica]